jgi:hypothetical protein
LYSTSTSTAKETVSFGTEIGSISRSKDLFTLAGI